MRVRVEQDRSRPGRVGPWPVSLVLSALLLGAAAAAAQTTPTAATDEAPAEQSAASDPAKQETETQAPGATETKPAEGAVETPSDEAAPTPTAAQEAAAPAEEPAVIATPTEPAETKPAAGAVETTSEEVAPAPTAAQQETAPTPEPATPTAGEPKGAPPAAKAAPPTPPSQDKKKIRDKAKTVSNAELVKLGFFQDFAELDLEALLMPEVEQVTASVATRSARPVDDAPGSLTIVNADEIRNLGAVTLGDVLRTIPGLDVSVDSLGRSRLSARGVPTGALAALSEGVVVLINGRRIDDGITGGATAISADLPVEGVTQVEVLRGPASALYGSGALTAVINIVTEEPAAFSGMRVTTSVGTRGTADVLRLSNTYRQAKVTGTIRYVGSWGAGPTITADAQTLRDRLAPAGVAPRSLAPGEALDGRGALETLYRVALGKLEAQWRVYQGEGDTYAGYANSLGNQGSLFGKQSSLSVRYRNEIQRLGTLTVEAGTTGNEQSQLFEMLPPGLSGILPDGRDFRVDSPIFLQTALKTTRRDLEARLEREERGHRLSAACSLVHEGTGELEALANLNYATGVPGSGSGLNEPVGSLPEISRTTLALGAQDVWAAASRLTLTGALRLDHLNDVGTRLSPRLALVARLPRDLTLRVVGSTGFRAPTFAEMYFTQPGFTGNRDLAAVTGQTVESGLTWQRTDLRVAGSLYLSRVRGLILAERPASPFVSPTLQNGPGLDVTGFELEGRRTQRFGTFFASYTYQHSRLTAGGGPVPELPAHLATLGANVGVGARRTLSLTWLLRSSRPRAADDEREALGGYNLVNVQLEQARVIRNLDVALALRNLFGQKYADPAPALTLPGDYPRPGRSLILFGRYRF